MCDELHEAALRNVRVFEEVLAAYVAGKLDQVLRRAGRTGWFDASGCVWCLFDDPGFVRSGDAARVARERDGQTFGLQVYWSMGDVIMPGECDEHWVAERIACEAERQLDSLGYRHVREERMTEEGMHMGVAYRKRRRAFPHIA